MTFQSRFGYRIWLQDLKCLVDTLQIYSTRCKIPKRLTMQMSCYEAIQCLPENAIVNHFMLIGVRIGVRIVSYVDRSKNQRNNNSVTYSNAPRQLCSNYDIFSPPTAQNLLRHCHCAYHASQFNAHIQIRTIKTPLISAHFTELDSENQTHTHTHTAQTTISQFAHNYSLRRRRRGAVSRARTLPTV